MLFVELMQVILRGFVSLCRLFAGFFMSLFRRLNTEEKVFLGVFFLAALLVILGWRGYGIELEPGKVFFHKIVTDDFGILVFCFLLAFIPVILYWIDEFSRQKLTKWLRISRWIGLAGITLVYFLDLIFPERIAPATEAHFTWPFFGFGLVLVGLLLTGYKSMDKLGITPSIHPGKK